MRSIVWKVRSVWRVARVLALAFSLPMAAAGCTTEAPPEPERKTLSITAEVPPRYREGLGRAHIIARLTTPLHALAAQDKRAAFDLAHDDEGVRNTDYQVDLAIKAAGPTSYRIDYRVAVGASEETGAIQRDADHIRRVGANLPYEPDGVFTVAVGRDLEVVGSRLALLIQHDLSGDD